MFDDDRGVFTEMPSPVRSTGPAHHWCTSAGTCAGGRFSDVRPVAVVIDGLRRVYVADDSSRGGILEFSPTGQLVAALQIYQHDGLPLPEDPTVDDMLRPTGVAVDRAGAVYLLDSAHSRLLSFSPKP